MTSRGRLTRATKNDRIRILVFFHHISRLTDRAPRLNAVACPAITSVLSTSRSILSPRPCSDTLHRYFSLWFLRTDWTAQSTPSFRSTSPRALVLGPRSPSSTHTFHVALMFIKFFLTHAVEVVPGLLYLYYLICHWPMLHCISLYYYPLSRHIRISLSFGFLECDEPLNAPLLTVECLYHHQ